MHSDISDNYAHFMHTMDFVSVVHLQIALYICKPHPYRLFLYIIYNASANLHIFADSFARIMAHILHLLFVFMLQAHTLLDMQFQCLLKPASVFQFSSVMVQLEHWSNIQFPPLSVFCLGSKLFLLHIKRHCDFSYITSTLTPTSNYFFITLFYCIFASLPLCLFFHHFLLPLGDPWWESWLSVSLDPSVQSQTQLPLRAQQLGWGRGGSRRCGVAQTWRRKRTGPRRPWWDSGKYVCGVVRLLSVWAFLHLLPILSGSVHWWLPFL